jgi:hypothetical protein
MPRSLALFLVLYFGQAICLVTLPLGCLMSTCAVRHFCRTTDAESRQRREKRAHIFLVACSSGLRILERLTARSNSCTEMRDLCHCCVETLGWYLRADCIRNEVTSRPAAPADREPSKSVGPRL